ncbi:MAG: PrsW family intramembrane metalloprotease [Saprospiraceae bacterium]
MTDFWLFLLAIAPSLIISQYIFRMDKYEREPRLQLIICFVLGILCTLPAMNMEWWGKHLINSDPHNLLKAFLFSTFIIALTEEILKFFSLMLYAYPRKHFNEPMDGIVYSTMISMGFAAMENILYVQNNPADAYEIVIARAFTAVPAHGLFGLAMGYCVGKAKMASSPLVKLEFCLTGLLVAIIFHGTYDFLLLQEMYQLLMMLATLSIVAGWYFSGIYIKRHQDISPFRNDIQQNMSVGELARMDRLAFVQNEEIIQAMLTRMHKHSDLFDNWGELYLDVKTGDKWLKFGVPSEYTDDVSPRLVRYPGPGVEEIIQLSLLSTHTDEIYAAANYLFAKENFENHNFREKLIVYLEELDYDTMAEFHRERIKMLMLATNLNSAEPLMRSSQPLDISIAANRILKNLDQPPV